MPKTEKDWTEVTWSLPKWAADLIFETLGMDAQSRAFDPALRTEIQQAIENIEEIKSE